ncbi:MAG TPA: hypothetical protein H9870_07595 [Candidatus Corynebacterium avicola]|uniref:Uncharacterized protein n=1 Tax=Candidatus Corynebacterium avicola TaxID=2838527 RepID=A0A9D1RN98_9CORY|nr:hypothetical protein [Candidatus Corynebacterium avicola]
MTPPPGLFPSDDNESSGGFGVGGDSLRAAEEKRSRRNRRLLIIVAIFAVVVAVGVAFFRWYSESYVVRPGGLGENAARAACEDAVRIESGYGEDAVLDLWGATIVPVDGADGADETDQWLVEGQVFAEEIRGVDPADGSRTDGEEFSCTVGEDDAVVTMR